nr:MAG TPA: hypothetical protein [Caudoviricetes sp.]
MCDILFVPSEVAYTHFGENVYREPAEERLPAGFSFGTNCGIIISTNPPGLSKKHNRVDICQLAQCFIWE